VCTLSLCNPEPHTLKEVPGDALWPNLSIESSLARPYISLFGLDEAGTLEEAPESVEEEVDLKNFSDCCICSGHHGRRLTGTPI
jgi:hypothetical protein